MFTHFSSCIIWLDICWHRKRSFSVDHLLTRASWIFIAVIIQMVFPFHVIITVIYIVEDVVNVVVAAVSVGTSHVCFLLLVHFWSLLQTVLRQLLEIYAFYRGHYIVILTYLVLCLDFEISKYLRVAFNVLPFLFKNIGRLRFLLNTFQVNIFISNIIHYIIFKLINWILLFILVPFSGLWIENFIFLFIFIIDIIIKKLLS